MTIPSKIVPFRPRTVGSGGAETVTFRCPFLLKGMDRPHRPGTFMLRETRTALDTGWPAFLIQLTVILVDGGVTEALDISRVDLDAALPRDIVAARS